MEEQRSRDSVINAKLDILINMSAQNHTDIAHLMKSEGIDISKSSESMIALLKEYKRVLEHEHNYSSDSVKTKVS